MVRFATVYTKMLIAPRKGSNSLKKKKIILKRYTFTVFEYSHASYRVQEFACNLVITCALLL